MSQVLSVLITVSSPFGDMSQVLSVLITVSSSFGDMSQVLSVLITVSSPFDDISQVLSVLITISSPFDDMSQVLSILITTPSPFALLQTTKTPLTRGLLLISLIYLSYRMMPGLCMCLFRIIRLRCGVIDYTSLRGPCVMVHLF